MHAACLHAGRSRGNRQFAFGGVIDCIVAFIPLSLSLCLLLFLSKLCSHTHTHTHDALFPPTPPSNLMQFTFDCRTKHSLARYIRTYLFPSPTIRRREPRLCVCVFTYLRMCVLRGLRHTAFFPWCMVARRVCVCVCARNLVWGVSLSRAHLYSLRK